MSLHIEKVYRKMCIMLELIHVCRIYTHVVLLAPEPLNPKPLHPELMGPKPLDPEPLGPQPLDPEPDHSRPACMHACMCALACIDALAFAERPGSLHNDTDACLAHLYTCGPSCF